MTNKTPEYKLDDYDNKLLTCQRIHNALFKRKEAFAVKLLNEEKELSRIEERARCRKVYVEWCEVPEKEAGEDFDSERKELS